MSTLHRRDDLNCCSVHVTDIDTGRDIVVAHTAGRLTRSPVWSLDGAVIAFADESPGWFEVFTVAADGSSAPLQLTHADADFTDLTWSADGLSIIAVRFRHGVGDLVEIDTTTGGVDVIAAGGTWSSPSWLSDGSVVAAHESHETPPELCRIARTTTGWKRDVLFAPSPASIRAAPHVRPEHIAYASLDGSDVYGWLYRPTEATQGTRVPVIVYPHGGPTSHTGDEWDGVAQYFLDQGYGWFAVNFRGSTTYGREYERANQGHWGVIDTHDCLAAYDHLATLDWVDPDRVGIFGSSYGSYMALHSLVDDPHHRYACGVAKYGDCDILTSWAQSDLIGRLDLERMMGHPAANRAAYEAGSPIHRIADMTAPIFVAHGEHDERVHPDQSKELVAELDRLGKTYEYVTYTTEAHGLLRAGPFLHFYTRLERFLDWYLR